MASADYKQCDVCGNKTFYDANLNYQWDDDKHDYVLDNLGDWAVLCSECSKEYKTVVVPREVFP